MWKDVDLNNHVFVFYEVYWLLCGKILWGSSTRWLLSIHNKRNSWCTANDCCILCRLVVNSRFDWVYKDKQDSFLVAQFYLQHNRTVQKFENIHTWEPMWIHCLYKLLCSILLPTNQSNRSTSMIILCQDNMLYYNGFYFHYNMFRFLFGLWPCSNGGLYGGICVTKKTKVHNYGALLICMNISVWSSASTLKGMG